MVPHAFLLSLLVAGRMAIVVSAERADGQPVLRYADRDGDRMAQVLNELGDFAGIKRLRQPRVRELQQALDDADAAAAADPHLEVLVYYSGHADENGLLLGRERLAFAELRRRIEESRAAVRVAFLDACHAGSVVRAKGGTPAPRFALEALPSNVRGAAILTASSSHELAQESSAIEGSYFTHHLSSALRGAGDRDGNGQVSLVEAYQYAYGRTLSATLPSLLGPQHPSYEYQLSGTGDFVITRLAQGRQALLLPAGAGPSYVISSGEGEIVAEVAPQPQRRVRLVLPAGAYHVAVRVGERARRADVVVRANGPDLVIDERQFKDVPLELAFAKGRRPEPRNEISADVALTGLGPGAVGTSPEFGVSYFRRFPEWSLGPRVAYGQTERSVQGVPYRFARWTATAALVRRLTLGFSEIDLGVSAGLSMIHERYSRRLATGQTGETLEFSARAPTAALLLGADLPLQRWLALRLQWNGGVELLRINWQWRLVPELRSSLALVFRL